MSEIIIIIIGFIIFIIQQLLFKRATKKNCKNYGDSINDIKGKYEDELRIQSDKYSTAIDEMRQQYIDEFKIYERRINEKDSIN